MLRGGAIGDFVVTLPVLELLRLTWPSARLELCAYPRVARLASASGLADASRSLDETWVARLFSGSLSAGDPVAAWLRSFELAMCFLHDPDGAVADNLRRIVRGSVVAISPIVTCGHAADHFLAPLAALVPATLPAVPRLRLPDVTLTRGRERASRLGGRVVTLHPGSGSPRKNWPTARFVEVARRIRREGGAEPVFVLGEADDAAREVLRREGPDFKAVEEPDLVEVAALLAAARCHVGNDSGLGHLAAAVGTPVVALFGPSDPAVWAPRGQAGVRVLCAAEPTTASLAAIPPDAVWEAVRQSLAGRQPSPRPE